MSYQNVCVQCGDDFESRRPYAETCSDPCKYQRWIEKNLETPSQPVGVHSLQAVREQQATKKHNRDLGGLIRQAIAPNGSVATDRATPVAASLHSGGDFAESAAACTPPASAERARLFEDAA